MTNIVQRARRAAAAASRGLRAAATWAANHLPEALMFGGATAITAGVDALIGRPAALITGGVLATWYGWRLGRG